MSSAADALPRQELLKKLLMMTTSTNDGEALTALRKANDLLHTAGWDWARLIDGRITVVEDPFKNLGTPPAARHAMNGRATTPTPPTPAPPPPRVGSPQNPISSTPNKFVTWCHCCGDELIAGAGYIFKVTPNDTKWSGMCASCNTKAFVYTQPARRKYNKRQTSVSDLA